MDLDFKFGKQVDLAARHHPKLKREYGLLWGLLGLTALPYLFALYYWPLRTLLVCLFAAYFQLLISFARSGNTGTSHYMRFLLSGSNPIGMAGGSSLLFGAVDAILDWREDQAERSAKPLFTNLVVAYKFAVTPLGIIMAVLEVLWDAALLRHPRMVLFKYQELFSLDRYHDLICPEKSNDVFYADLAICRYKNDPWLYQWNRLRAMVFELEQYRQDALESIGVPETNLFLQDDVAAYQTLKRLKLEQIEAALSEYYDQFPNRFPFPGRLAKALIRNARPIFHYLSMRSALSPQGTGGEVKGPDSAVEKVMGWKLLRLLDSAAPISVDTSRYVSEADLDVFEQEGVLSVGLDGYRFTEEFLRQFYLWLTKRYEEISSEDVMAIKLAKVPGYFEFRGKCYVKRVLESN